jgi:hypothetical protein
MTGGNDNLSRQLALSNQLGWIEEQIRTLFKKFDTLEENSTREHRIVHDVVVATSESVRNLAKDVTEMKPLTKDYELKRAEDRGARRFIKTAYALGGGSIAVGLGKALEYFSARPHP